MQVITTLCLALAGSVAIAGPTPAFPGAEGAGAMARGGRGGRVIYVRNLHDSGAGSLRAAVNEKGPRTVLFAVAGTIDLAAPIEIVEPSITIAGQSTPGGGICLRNYELVVRTHDVILRHLRVRSGDRMKKAVDGISVGAGAHDVIIDHCSVSWSVDECMSVSGVNIGNITVQWCLIAESLNRSVHHKGPHGYGSLIRADGDVSYHHNIYAHHNSRSPRPGTYGDKRGIILDFRNNVVYGWGSRAGYSSADRADINYVANFLKPNASSKTPAQAFNVGGPTTRLYIADNVLIGAAEANADNWKMVGSVRAETRMTAPFPIAPVRTDRAELAYERTLDAAGATKPRRDAVDARIVRQIREGSGRIIDSQDEVGGWPALATGAAPSDADGDGMPDDWERSHGFNPANPGDGAADADGNGYTNLEEFLNASAARSVARG